MKGGSGDETDQHRCAICDTNTHFWTFVVFFATGGQWLMLKFLYHTLVKDWQRCILPSSTTTAMFPSGERPTHVMFFVVETGNVSDVLLEERKEEINQFCFDLYAYDGELTFTTRSHHHALFTFVSLATWFAGRASVQHPGDNINDSPYIFMYLIMTYFFRSKTETLFPTGLITALPSLEKLKFPWR